MSAYLNTTSEVYTSAIGANRSRAMSKPGNTLHSIWTYLLLLPILFWAADGSFSFENAAANNRLGASHSELLQASPLVSFIHNCELALVIGIVIYAILIRFPDILSSLKDVKRLVALPLLALASCVWSAEPSRTLLFGSFLLLNTLFAVYLAQRFTPTNQMKFLVLAGTCVTIASLLCVFVPPYYGVSLQTDTGAWRGLASHKNIYSAEVAFLMSPMLFLSLTGRFRIAKRLAYISMCLVQIALSQSRTGWMLAACCLISALYFKALVRFCPRDRIVIASVTTALGLLLAPVLATTLPDILNSVGKDATFTGRTAIWDAVLQSIAKRPLLGFGYYGFWNGIKGESANVILSLGNTVTHAHNGLLNVALQLGVVGVIALLISLCQCFVNGMKCWRLGSAKYVGWYMAVIVMCLLLSVDEQGMLQANTLSWFMYMVAYIGLATEAKKCRAEARRA